MKPFVDYLFIVYFSVLIEQERKYKSIIRAKDKEEAKTLFEKKIKRDLKGFKIKNIKTYKLNKKKYRGKPITDKQWEKLQLISYPNTRHKLKKIPKKQWFKPIEYPKRNLDGTFKEGFVPWNKGLKLKIFLKDSSGKFIKHRDDFGRFKKGIQVTIIGSNYPTKNENIKPEKPN